MTRRGIYIDLPILCQFKKKARNKLPILQNFRKLSEPSIKFDSKCVVGLPDLHYHAEAKRLERHTMDRLAYKHYRWYNGILQQELYSAPTGFKLQIIHWTIKSGVTKAFHIDGNTFEAVTMIIGPVIEHWFGAAWASREYCAHGHSQRLTLVSTTTALPVRPLVIAQEFVEVTTQQQHSSGLFKEQSVEISKLEYNNTTMMASCYCNGNETPQDDAGDDCQDIFTLRITLSQMHYPKRARKCDGKFISSMITINEE